MPFQVFFNRSEEIRNNDLTVIQSKKNAMIVNHRIFFVQMLEEIISGQQNAHSIVWLLQQ